jgi:hypothetical protein
MKRSIRRAVVGGGLALILAGAAASSATAAPATWLPVRLGIHRFGHLSRPEAIVAKAGPRDVGFWIPENGEGPGIGPWSFDVAVDGSIWLMDEFNDRLLVWSPGHPRHPRIFPLSVPAPVDFALGRGNTMYVFSKPPGDPGWLYSITSAGKLRWKERTIVDIFNSQLRMGPDGALYYYSPSPPDELGGWVPVATPAGRPISLAEQRRRASRHQPMPGGLRLVTNDISEHRKEFSLLDGTGHAVRAWRVTSTTMLGLTLATSSMVGRDLVATVDVSRQSGSDFVYEHLVLRLGSAGGTRARLMLDPHVIDGLDPPITELRVGPDGHFYQLRTSPKTGVSIARYSLEPRQAPQPKPTPTSGGVAPPAQSPTSPKATQGPPSPTGANLVPAGAESPASSSAQQSRSHGSRALPLLGAISACAAMGLGLYTLRRKRNRVTLSSSA